MLQLRRFHRGSIGLVAVAVIATAGCGSSDSTTESTSDSTTDSTADPVDDTAAPVDDDAATTTVESDTAATSEVTAEPSVETTTPPVEVDGSSDEVQLAFSDGRTWTFIETTCRFDPDASGPAAAVLIIDGYNDGGAEFGVIEAWPLDGNTDTGTSFIGTFTDEDEELYVLADGSAAMVGDVVELTSDYHTNVFYELEDEPAGTLTVRCQP